VFYPQRQINAGTVMRYHFSNGDTIKKESYVSIMCKLDSLSQYDYPVFPIKNDNAFLFRLNSFHLLLSAFVTSIKKPPFV
jgi:hypothetical protein